MTIFKCHRCGKTSVKSGLCCGSAMEKTCGICGSAFDCCICTGGSTKEPKMRH